MIGSYELGSQLAVGGMASVHLGRSIGPRGSRRLVAVKRLHQHLASDEALSAALLQEARITQCIAHPNVVATLDVVSLPNELLLVLEYVRGATVGRIMRALSARGDRCAPEIAARIAIDALHGLAAAHATKASDGSSLGIVHRDVSPQNIIVTTDGTARVLDFGVAKMIGSQIHTRTGEVKGKIPYMAPEVLDLEPATAQADVWGLAVVLWEMLCGKRLFVGETEVATWSQVLNGPIATPAEVLGAPTPLDDVVMRGLDRDRDRRYASAEEMARDIERAVTPASHASVASWMIPLVDSELVERERMVEHFEDTRVMPAISTPPLAPPASAPATTPEAAPRSRSSRAPWAIATVLAVAVAFLAWPRRAPPVISAAPSASASVSIAPPADSVVHAVPPLDTPSAARAEPPPSKARPSRVTAPARRSDPCDPPYSVDAQGHKVFKRECVK